MFDRRTVMGLTATLAALPGLAKAQTGQANAQSAQQEGLPLAPASGPGIRPPLPGFDIWPGDAPGGEQVTTEEKVVLRKPGGDPNDTAFYHVRKPWLIVRKPEKPNGGAVLIAPGGAYIRVAVSKAGSDIDAWLAGLGYTVFTMDYRLPGDNWAAGPDVALQDVQRAIRLIRSKSAEFGLDPARLAVMGFSAGGHVAGLAATRFNDTAYAPIDAVDTLSAKPTVVAMCYPVVTATLPYAHIGSVNELIGRNPTDEQRKRASVEQHVPADAAPTFVCATTDDPVVPMHNAMMMFDALKAQKVPSELHLYEGATHGFPLRDKGGSIQPWALTALTFMERHGLKAV
jgi:acetyl esterase/lipase